ncbi:metal-dependent hydrolase family protein [Thalassomonas actiniarum]|uniref:Amidohydrolase family protein n=1 Tax=Thalassomonas actiniarum TaxID=485447 RepID=A0AAE9YV33_9GAMM|nr:amidohydrolase family protein [Thalassomonas actiniarum]WDE01368.1 amidohydrolase family protein [Thalassomonas actiniarum]
MLAFLPPRKSLLSAAACLLFTILPATSWAQVQVIHAGQLLAVPGQAPLKQQTLVVTDGKITGVFPGYISLDKFADDARLIDLSSSFVMPGLMDMHVHLQGELGPNNDSETLRLSDADVAMKSVFFAEKTLMSGFTTVRDLGAKPEQIYALRDAIDKGWVSGPRIIAAGRVSITGGHADVDGMRADLLEKFTAKTVCDGPFDCRRATRRAIKFGADLIKITSTGGVLSDTNTGTGVQMTDGELKEVVETAHGLGRKVASHAHAAAGINAALRAGVDSIEHGSYADEESIRLFKQSGAYLVPTLLAGDTVVNMAKTADFMSDDIKAKAIRVGGDMLKNFSRAQRAGVNIAFGTDSGVSRHGGNAREAVLMFEGGMSAAEILKSATVNAAKLIGYQDSLGTLEKGKLADIIATGISPLEDISALLTVDFVMKAGKVVKAHEKS